MHTIFTDEIRGPIVPGFVLSGIQLDPVSGKPLTHLSAAKEATRLSPIYDAVGHLIQSAIERRQ